MSNFSASSLQEQKQRMREEMREKRRAKGEENKKYAQPLAAVFLKHFALPENAVIASYCAFRDEIDPTPLCDALRDKGHIIALPIITHKREPLIFRRYEPGDLLLANPMNIFEPASTAPSVEPDIVLVPMLAFDAGRNRLGYGGGFYDRTIATLRAHKKILALGLAYSYQQVDKIPTGQNDIILDHVVTELKIL